MFHNDLFFSVFLCLVFVSLVKRISTKFLRYFQKQKIAINALQDTIHDTIRQSDCKRYLCVALFWLYSTYHSRCNWISFISLKVIFFNVTAFCFCFCCVAIIPNWNGTRALPHPRNYKSKEDYFRQRIYFIARAAIYKSCEVIKGNKCL